MTEKTAKIESGNGRDTQGHFAAGNRFGALTASGTNGRLSQKEENERAKARKEFWMVSVKHVKRFNVLCHKKRLNITERTQLGALERTMGRILPKEVEHSGQVDVTLRLPDLILNSLERIEIDSSTGNRLTRLN